MAIPHAKPGEIVDVRPLESALASAQTHTLVRAEQVEVIRLVVPAGKQIEEHKAKGEIVVRHGVEEACNPRCPRRLRVSWFHSFRL
jgi:hypothetical protein